MINFNNVGILESGVSGTVHNFMTLPDMLREILKAVVFAAHTELGGTFWLFKVLFSVSYLYFIFELLICKVVGRNKEDLIINIQGIISLVFLFVGWMCFVLGVSLFGMARTLSIYSLYHLGRVFKQRHFNKKFINRKMFIISLIILIGLNFIGSVSLDINSYENPVFLMIASIVGWCLVNYMTCIIVKIKKISCFVGLCGEASLYIMIFHFISFKGISFLQVLIYNKPLYYMAAFPVLYTHGMWTVIYAGVGVIIPLVIYRIVIGIRKRMIGRSF